MSPRPGSKPRPTSALARAGATKPDSYLDAQARAGGTFRLRTDFTPQGDQQQAIDRLAEGIREGRRDQVLLGVTGSGKTFTMAKVIEAVNRPTLVLSPNNPAVTKLLTKAKQMKK